MNRYPPFVVVRDCLPLIISELILADNTYFGIKSYCEAQLDIQTCRPAAADD